MERKTFNEWFVAREAIGQAPMNMNGTDNLSPEGQTAVEKLKMLLHGSPPEIIMSVLSDPMKLMRKYRLDPHEVQEVIKAVQDDLT